MESLQKRGWYPNYVEADPDDKVELHLKLCEKYLREAEQLTQKGGYVQASEKAWGAAAQIVDAVASKRGEELKSHGDLWRFVTKLRERLEMPSWPGCGTRLTAYTPTSTRRGPRRSLSKTQLKTSSLRREVETAHMTSPASI